MINNYIPSTSIFKQDLINIYGGNDEQENSSSSSEVGFGDVLKSELNKVNDTQVKADDSIKGYLNGDLEIQEVMLATQEASLSLNLAIEIRNKLVDAYKELNNMQV
ncbi:MAG: flagellar hook-basal body complex protein FliE [Clostridium sp.]|nr:flagellar hook-basal body complex protein FliE [Clostridium sp.]